MAGLLTGLSRVFCEWIKSICLFCVPNAWRFKDITQEVVLITGGGSGIGRLLAVKLASRASRVVLLDVSKSGLKETAALVSEAKGSCAYYVCDISSRQEVYSIAERIKEEVGFVSMVINNAGITGGAKRLSDLDDERIVKTMEVNALAQFWVTKAFLADMMSHNHGHIVFVASYAGLIGGCNLADYCASKFAVMGLAESLTVELRADGYDINTTAVCPFLINTGLFQGAAGNRYIPTLDAEETAKRIVDAILLNQSLLLMPRTLYFTIFLKTLLPVSAAYELYKALDGLSFMQGFTGRRIECVNNNDPPSLGDASRALDDSKKAA